MIVVDASAAIKLVLAEPASDLVRRLWDEPIPWVAPAIVLAEVAAGISAAHRGGRLRAAAARRAQATWRSVSDEIDLLTVDPALATAAAGLAATRAMRGTDAIYLAAAERVGGTGPVALLSFDRRQRAGVGPAGGVGLLPADLD